jgi:hypothetical protein
MAQSIFIFKRKTQAMPAERFHKLAAHLGLKGDLVETDEALFARDGDGVRALAYAQPCAKFAGLLFFVDQSVAWGETADKLVSEKRAYDWTHELLKQFELRPNASDDNNIRLDFELKSFQTEAVVFDGRERRRMKVKTDVTSQIALNGIRVDGPRGKVRLVFKSDNRPVMMHIGLWESLAVYEERELIREDEAARLVRDRIAGRGDNRSKSYDIHDVHLIYYADEFRGGPEILAPEYLVEVEFHDPRYTGKQPIQGPRQVIRVPAFR